MYTRLVHRPRELRPRHSVENQWDLLRAVDAGFPASPDPVADRVEMAVPSRRARGDRRDGCAPWECRRARADRPARERGQSVPALAGSVVCRVGRGPRRRLGRSMGAHHRRAVRSRGGSAGDRRGPDARGRGLARIVDAEGLSLVELRALIDRAALFVGGDSGPLHVASTSDVPIVGLYGPTLPARSAPWRPRALRDGVGRRRRHCPAGPCDQRVCAPGDFRCLTGVPADAVRAAAEALLRSER